MGTINAYDNQFSPEIKRKIYEKEFFNPDNYQLIAAD
tara:strand:- start:120 stop:230 length:111 start_codon:yes stop_codon:yes gene_type:complete